MREIPQIHSVRVRVKDPRHLIKKILRKRIEDASRDIRFENYQQEVTDLIGIRALHLYKGDWLGIHNFIKEEWDTAETPIAYIREGDNPELTKEYEKNGCEVKLHPRKYRSIHYSIYSSASKTPIIAEVQTRTLFEEAWSEIDHQINYPETAVHNIVALYLELFNRYAGSADEMGSLLQFLVEDLRLRDLNSAQIASERDEALGKVEELLKKVEMGKTERAELEKELLRLRNTQTSSASPTSGLTNTMALALGIPALSATSLNSFFGTTDSLGIINAVATGVSTQKLCKSCSRELGFLEVEHNGECMKCYDTRLLNFPLSIKGSS